jgi:hypothetical protein
MPCSGKASLRGQLTKRPINWRRADAAKLIELAAKLAQLAARLKDAPGSGQAQDSAGRVAIYLLDNGRDCPEASSEHM